MSRIYSQPNVCRLVFFILLALFLSGGLHAKALEAAQPPAVMTDPDRYPADEQLVFGASGAGRPLTAYRFGSGKNVLVLGFAIHGYEDAFPQDGYALVYTAETVMAMLAESYLPAAHDWTVWVIPCINPDGLLDGYTTNGPGRCTTMHYGTDGVLRDGGLDLNRNFPVGFSRNYSSRNFSGLQPLSAPESIALADFLQDVQGSGTNILVDVHGWLQGIFTYSDYGSTLHTVFSEQFPQNYYYYPYGAQGYLIRYADSLGYEACMFEFPWDIHSMEEFYEAGYAQAFTRAIENLLQSRPCLCDTKGHRFSSAYDAPTCTAEGKLTFTCQICTHTMEVPLAMTGHTFIQPHLDGQDFLADCAICGRKDLPLPPDPGSYRADAFLARYSLSPEIIP